MFSKLLHFKRFVIQYSSCLNQIPVTVLWLNVLSVDFSKTTLTFVEGWIVNGY